MSYLQDRKLKFIVNGQKVEIGPIHEVTFDKNWYSSANQYGETTADRDFFDYCTAVDAAISEYEGYKIFAHHLGGQIAFEGWDEDGSLVGNYTVYSDYTDMHSIDAGQYMQVLKNIE